MRRYVGAGFKPALLRHTTRARYSLDHPLSIICDCNRAGKPRGLRLWRHGGFQTRPYMNLNSRETVKTTVPSYQSLLPAIGPTAPAMRGIKIWCDCQGGRRCVRLVALLGDFERGCAQMKRYVGAGFKPALVRHAPLARYSLGHPPSIICDCNRAGEPRSLLLLRQGGFETRPYMNLNLREPVKITVPRY
jgi:hypothetical protein